MNKVKFEATSFDTNALPNSNVNVFYTTSRLYLLYTIKWNFLPAFFHFTSSFALFFANVPFCFSDWMFQDSRWCNQRFV